MLKKAFLVFLFLNLNTVGVITPSWSDSSSPLLAAYYDRQMAIVKGITYAWRGNDTPKPIEHTAIQVGVGDDSNYILSTDGILIRFDNDNFAKPRILRKDILRFAAGDSGVLAIDNGHRLLWVGAGTRRANLIAKNVHAAAVGDSANYYITKSGDLFVKGKAHRGQYGDGRLVSTDHFVRTATSVGYITAHTGHAILLKGNGDVFGTGGNIYGPVGKHGIGDKAVRWSKIVGNATAIATGSSHTVAILKDSKLVAWGSEYGTDPKPIMNNVVAVAAGSNATIALKTDGSLWQWDRGERPRKVLPN
ncbi:MAG: hypothetical protein CMM52_00375 [Rhodospirillaceae bacterium]|nr:hypothetical protein [Rhodospirillaceae bacterium]|tara:strand:- start:9199 stop:10113 length:915 start_codon:yes stop_codon:yes gene_type:complete